MTIQVASAQYPVTYHTSFHNWKLHIESWVKQAVSEKAQLLLFPEYGAMELVSLLPGELQTDLQAQVRSLGAFQADFCSVFSELADKYRVIIAAPSFPVLTEGCVNNTCFVFGPRGKMGKQDKYFMTRFETEDWLVESSEPVLSLFETEWGQFGIQICYDIEFPIGAAALCQQGAGLLLVPSCTETLRGATRVHVGARARALEQQCYTLVSPLVGTAPWSPAVDVNFGYAASYSTPDYLFPEEGILQKMNPQQPGWMLQQLDLTWIEKIRADGQTLNFKDNAVLESAVNGQAFQVNKVYL
jgi:predicted amidohydrolase